MINALFVKINGRWQFQGFEDDPKKVSAFEDRVLDDIKRTADLEIRTEDCCIVLMPE